MSRSRLVARNLGVTMATQVISWGLTFLVTLYLPKYLGDLGLGKLTLGMSFGVVFALFLELGLNTVLIRDIARDREKTGEYTIAAVGIRFVMGLVAIGLATLTAKVLGYSTDVQALVAVCMASTVVSQLNDALASALRGLENFPKVSAAALCEKVVNSVVTITLVVHQAPLWMIASVLALSMSCSICVSLPALWPHIRRAHLPGRAVVRELLVSGRPFWTVAIFSALYTQIDPILLSKMSSINAVGWYGLVKRLSGPTFFIPIALSTTMLPTLTRIYQEDQAVFAVTVRRLVNLALICAVPFAAVLIMAPGQIIRLLHYPPAFNHSIPVLMIFGCAVVIWYLTQVLGFSLVACNRQAALSRTMATCALLSVPTCATGIFFAERFLHNGAIGAISSDVIIETIMLVLYVKVLPPDIFRRDSFYVLARAAMAALPLILIFYLVHDRHSLFYIVIGLILYAPLCWFFKCLHPQDMQMLKQILRRKANA